MTFPADRIGDKGQRFELQIEGFPEEEWSIVGWAETEDGGRRMSAVFMQHPCAKRSRLWDRHEDRYIDVHTAPSSEAAA